MDYSPRILALEATAKLDSLQPPQPAVEEVGGQSVSHFPYISHRVRGSAGQGAGAGAQGASMDVQTRQRWRCPKVLPVSLGTGEPAREGGCPAPQPV